MSFYANKHVTTGEGGVVLTDDDEVKNKIKQMRNLDFTNKKRFYHDNLFWNYRLGGLQAALGISQLSKLEKTIGQKIKQAGIYDKYLSNSNKISLPVKNIGETKNHYWVYGVVLNQEGIRDLVMDELYQQEVETRPFFGPMHLQDALPVAHRQNVTLPNTEHISENGLYLPLGKHLTKKDQKYIAEKLLNILDKNS